MSKGAARKDSPIVLWLLTHHVAKGCIVQGERPHELRPVGDVEYQEELADVILHRTLGYSKLLGDFRIARPLKTRNSTSRCRRFRARCGRLSKARVGITKNRTFLSDALLILHPNSKCPWINSTNSLAMGGLTRAKERNKAR